MVTWRGTCPRGLPSLPYCACASRRQATARVPMKRELGFTLLELLIGMTLLGFIMALLFGGFRLAANSWDAVEVRAERTNDEQLARALVRRVLTQLQPLRWKRALNQRITFIGESDGLRAVGPLTAQAGAAGLRLIELVRQAGDRGALKLVLRHAPLRYDVEDFSEPLEDARSHVILDGLEEVEFSYFGSLQQNEPPRWQDRWEHDEQMPQLVRVRLRSREQGWTDVVVAPMIGGSNCTWDKFHRRCL